MLAAEIELLQSSQTRMTADGQEQALSGQWQTGSNRCRTDSRTYAPALPQRQCTDQGCSCVQERRRAESTTNPAPNFCTKGVLMPSRAAASSANRPPRRAGEASPNRRLMTSSNFWGSVQTGAVHTSAT